MKIRKCKLHIKMQCFLQNVHRSLLSQIFNIYLFDKYYQLSFEIGYQSINFHKNKMKIIPIIVLILLSGVEGAFDKIEDCLYIDAIKVYGTSSSVLSSSPGHQFQLNWNGAQNSIIASSYTLMGFQVQQADAIFGFQAFFTGMNNISGVLNVYPIPNSAISYLYFSIILVKASTLDITLKFLTITPSVFTSGRTSGDDQFVNVNLNKNFKSDTYNYLARAFISSFVATSSSFVTGQQIGVDLLPINAGTSRHTIQISSRLNYQNVYSKICLTYILFYVPSFNYRIHFLSDQVQYYLVSGLIAMGTPLSAANNYLPPFRKCIFGLIWYKLPAIGPNVAATVKLIYPGTRASFITEFSHSLLTGIKELGLCLGACPLEYYVDPQATTYQCLPCANLVLNCRLCNPNGTCDECLDNYFLLPSANLCFLRCPNRYYSDIATKHCLPCQPQCIKCSNFSSCITCKKGWPVEGGCTTVVGCSSMSGSVCVRCRAEEHFRPKGNDCSCILPYSVATRTCINDKGCITANKVRNQTLCQSCNMTLDFVLVDSACQCRDGYEPSGDKCIEICGDGRLFILDCDDGNNNDGDGCSANCEIEKKYKCRNGSASSPSVCKYLRRDITFSVVLVDKVDSMNRAKFVFTFSPNSFNLAKLNFSQAASFQCNQKISINSIGFTNGTLTILVDYFQTLQDNNAMITVSLNPILFHQVNASASFRMNSVGQKLILSNKQQIVQFYKFILIGLSAFALLLFVVSSLVHKMVGLELLHTFQVIYFAHFSTKDYTHTYGVLRYLSFSAWNFLNFSEGLTHIDSVSHHLQFSINSQLFTELILLSLSIIVAIILILKQLIINMNFKPDNQRKILINNKIFNKLQAIFQLLSNILIGSIIVFLLIKSTIDIPNLHTHTWLTYCTTFIVIGFICIFVREWRRNSENYPSSNKKIKNNNKRSYALAYLSIIFATAFLISLNYHYQQFMAIYPLLGIQCIFLVWIIKAFPYESFLDNFGVILNRVTMEYFLVWSIMREQFSQLQSEQIQISSLAFLLLLLFLISLLGLIRIIYEVKRKSNKKQENKDQHGQVGNYKKVKQKKEAKQSWKIQHLDIKKKKERFTLKIVDDFHQERLKDRGLMQRQRKTFLLNERLT